MDLDQKPSEKADSLLRLLIQHQPSLITSAPGCSSKGDGEKVAEFIDALRSKLIDMYNLKNHG